MTQVAIYHNPRCSKSRQTLKLLIENNLNPKIILYLETPPDAGQIRELLRMLEIPARNLIRSSEQEYTDQNLADTTLSDADLINAIVNTPKLLQRPIVVSNGKAVIGRPPENVFAIV